jgi:hypothetical protein
MTSMTAMRSRTRQRRRGDSNARQNWFRAAYQRRTLAGSPPFRISETWALAFQGAALSPACRRQAAGEGAGLDAASLQPFPRTLTSVRDPDGWPILHRRPNEPIEIFMLAHCSRFWALEGLGDFEFLGADAGTACRAPTKATATSTAPS